MHQWVQKRGLAEIDASDTPMTNGNGVRHFEQPRSAMGNLQGLNAVRMPWCRAGSKFRVQYLKKTQKQTCPPSFSVVESLPVCSTLSNLQRSQLGSFVGISDWSV